ncbi:hypothetical protein ACFQL1_16305 [Halomicroarcula sp. GCM10025709]|uniref:hypothetical protein n=1 Tax=Haloarcula TaxID=2237 RepID=UPI0024C2EA80|nr:hypothetical protein [Halomicroarcula sp. YJ-61-S]
MHAHVRSTAEKSATDQAGESNTEQPTATTGGAVSCPNCNCDIHPVPGSEAVCPRCDFVLTDRPLSTEIDFDSIGSQYNRTGSRQTSLYADKGLGAGITENATTDGNGGVLSSEQRRITESKGWTKHRSTTEVRLDYALGEIRRMGAEFNISSAELEHAGQLYQQAHREGLITGRSVEGFSTACLLIAIRQSSRPVPVSIRELEPVARASTTQIKTARGAMELELGVKIPPIDPSAFVPKAFSVLSTPWRVEQRVRDLLDGFNSSDEQDFCGISPRTAAAAAVHAAYDMEECDDRPTLSELSEIFDVNETTISSQKSELLDCYGGGN